MNTVESDLPMTENRSPEFIEALLVWLKIGVLSFGGPAAQIALMHRILVDEKGWLNEKQFLNALSFCMLLPGPEAMQLATYAGWRLHGIKGGLAAGLSFVIPGAIVVGGLAYVYAILGDVAWVSALFLGIKAVVLVIVFEALLRVSKRAMDGFEHYLIAALAFVGIFFLQLPYPIIVFAAALYGFWFGGRSLQDSAAVSLPARSSVRTLETVVVGLIIWWLPVLILWALGGNEVLVTLAVFFSKLAVVTFGGAYAVLAYIAQDVVVQFGWLSPEEVMDGLGLAETTPGPLILVTEFVGFLAAFKACGVLCGIAGASVTLWVTFVPCFLWIFAGAPYIDWISAQPRLRSALAAITAAVVGVILNLSVWFGLHVLFTQVTPTDIGLIRLWWPDPGSIDWRVGILVLLSGVLLLKLHWSVFRVLSVAALCGVLFGSGL